MYQTKDHNVRVYPTRWHPLAATCAGGAFPILRAWSVWVDGAVAQTRVVDCPTGLTMIDSRGEMIDCWHAGIKPGDLARLRYLREPSLVVTGIREPATV